MNYLHKPFLEDAHINVAVTQLYFTETMTLKTILGSCVSVVIFSNSEKMFNSSMSHYLLAGNDITSNGLPDQNKYGEILLEKQIHGMISKTENHLTLKAMVFGGANLNNHYHAPLIANIGRKNIEIALDKLKYNGIEIVAQDVGGETARFIEFDPIKKKALVRRLVNNEVFTYS